MPKWKPHAPIFKRMPECKNSDKPSTSCHLENWSNVFFFMHFHNFMPLNWLRSILKWQLCGRKATSTSMLKIESTLARTNASTKRAFAEKICMAVRFGYMQFLTNIFFKFHATATTTWINSEWIIEIQWMCSCCFPVV